MIKAKDDLKYYLKEDKRAFGIPCNRRCPRPMMDHIWKYEILGRKIDHFYPAQCF